MSFIILPSTGFIKGDWEIQVQFEAGTPFVDGQLRAKILVPSATLVKIVDGETIRTPLERRETADGEIHFYWGAEPIAVFR